MRRALAIAALVAGGLSACGGGGTEPWTLVVSGRADLVRGGDTAVLDDGEHRVDDGDRIELVEGRAVLTLPDDATLELRSGRGTADDSRLRVADVPELLDGEMLLVGAGEAATAVAGAAELSITDGALRVRRGASVTVGVYGGTPLLSANGRVLEDLRPLRQATVSDSGALPRELQPVSYDVRSPDPWDVRFLGDAIDLDDQITRRQLAVAQNAERSDLAPLVQELAGEVPVDADRSIGETVVGAAIARAGQAGDVADRWREVFAFRDDGAPWGIVALDQRAERAAVLDALDRVVGRLVQLFGGVAAAPTDGSTGVDGEVAGGAIAPVTPASPTPPSTPGTGSGGTEGPTTPPTTVPPRVGPPPTLPLLPTPTLPELPGLDDGADDDPPPPPPAEEPDVDPPDDAGSSDGGVSDVVDAIEDVPVIGDVVDDLLDDGGLLGGLSSDLEDTTEELDDLLGGLLGH